MARRRVSKLQVSGESWHAKKYVQAAVQGLPVSKETATGSAGIFLGGGGAIVAGACALMFVMSMLDPASEQGDAPIMTTQAGGLYVQHEGRLHPVTNLASARLITGSADKASVVDEKSLSRFPRGNLMGIPAAPNSLAYRDDTSASWGVCDWQDNGASLSLTKAETLETTIVAGSDAWDTSAKTLDAGSGNAMLVRPDNDPSKRWLLFGDRRAEVDVEDYATHAALGLSAAHISNAITVSDAFLSTIPTLPVITAPDLKRVGQASTAVPKYKIGDVLVTADAAGANVYYSVTDEGLQRITRLVADLLINRGGSVFRDMEPNALAVYPQSQEIDLSAYPATAPRYHEPAAACFVWSKPREGGVPATHIVFGNSVPVKPDYGTNAAALLPEVRGSSKSADFFVTKPGKGWYVRVTDDGDNASTKGQVAYITDGGTWHNINPVDGTDYETIVGALGLSGVPIPIPSSVARQFPVGPDLDMNAALVEHVEIPVDIADGKQRNPKADNHTDSKTGRKPKLNPPTDQPNVPDILGNLLGGNNARPKIDEDKLKNPDEPEPGEGPETPGVRPPRQPGIREDEDFVSTAEPATRPVETSAPEEITITETMEPEEVEEEPMEIAPREPSAVGGGAGEVVVD